MLSQTLDDARERLRPYVERARGFSGWTDMPRSRPLSPDLPWDYMARAHELVVNAVSVLDIGTGGGERLMTICEGYQGRGVATEEWEVNAPVAASALRSLGFGVVHCADERLPFRDGAFDLILNRHSSLDPLDVPRLLTRGGTLLTQQVGHDSWPELSAHFPRRTDFGDHWRRYREGLAVSGLTIKRAERFERTVAYDDLGAFVHMLCIAPWEVPELDPLGSDLPALLEMERDLVTSDGFVITEVRYIIEAQKLA